ncbi:MAG: TIR domain-containing protein [Anaerolineae bacterium]|nr:TIR domain-containing protein [Anaerolineae bacterium]
MSFSDVFVSYRRTDVEFTKQLDQALKATGREVWVDWEDIPPGSENFGDDIQRGIESSHAFIAVLSPKYLESPYCLQELEYAVKHNKKLIPIVYQKFDGMPIPPSVAPINWIYFTPHAGQTNTFEESFPKVIAALQADYAYARRHTQLALRAQDWEKKNRNRSLLLKGLELSEALGWLTQSTGKDPAPLPLHLEYIYTSRNVQLRQRYQLIIGTILTLMFAIASLYLYSVAQTAARENYSTRLLEAANDVADSDQLLALQLALYSQSTMILPETEIELSALAYAPSVSEALLQHDAQITALKIHPTENLALSAAMNGTVVVWDLADNRPRWSVDHPAGRIVDLDWHPSQLQFALVSDYEQIVEVWEVGNATPLQTFTHRDGVTQVTFDQAGERLLSSALDNITVLWDLNTGQSIKRFLTDETVSASALRGNYAALGFNNGDVLLINLQTDERTLFQLHLNTVTQVAFDPEGRCVASSSIDRLVITYAIDEEDEGFCGRDYLDGHDDYVQDLAFDQLGRLYTVGSDRRVLRWTKIVNRNGWARYHLDRQFHGGHETAITSIAPTPNGQYLLTGGSDGTILRWDNQHGAAALEMELEGSVIAAIPLPDQPEQFFALTRETGDLVRWELGNPTPLQTIASGEPTEYGLLALHQDRLIYRSQTQLFIWQHSTGESVSVSDIGPGFGLAVSPDGTQAIFGRGRTIVVWDLATQSEVFTLSHPEFVYAFAYHPRGESVIFGDELGGIHRLNLATRTVTSFDNTHTDLIYSLVFNADGSRFASTSFDQSVTLWEWETGSYQSLTEPDAAVRDVAFDPSGQFIAAGSEDSRVMIWTLEDLQIVRDFNDYERPISGLWFDPSGQFVRAVSSNGRLINWRMEDLRTLLGWVGTERYLRELTCSEIRRFRLENQACD